MANVEQISNAATAAVQISNNMEKTTDNIVQMVGTGSNRVYGDGAAAVEKIYTDGGNIAGKAAEATGNAAEAIGNSIESLYGTFTNTVLPAVGQGLVITKDYFVDLFSRYAMYLAITDGILVLAELIAIGFSIAKIRSVFKTYAGEHNTTEGQDVMNTIGTMCAFVVIVVAVVWLTTDLPNFVKDILIPEFRVGEQLLEFKTKLGK